MDLWSSATPTLASVVIAILSAGLLLGRRRQVLNVTMLLLCDYVMGAWAWKLVQLKAPRVKSAASSSSFLKGKSIWITGASSGLGKSLAIAAAEGGASALYISGRRKEALEAVGKEATEAAQKAGSPSPRIEVLTFDLCDQDAVQHAVDDLQKKGIGNIDILVNNAGVSTRAAAIDSTLEVDRQVMETNFFSAVTLTKAVLPGMVAKGWGHIVVINSVQGKIALPYRTAYSASKHACTGYFDALRAEIARKGVAVTCVFPGYIRTDLSMNALAGDGSKYGKLDATTAAGEEPSIVAAQVWEAAAKGKPEIVLAPLKVKVACIMRTLAPGMLFKIMAKRGEKEAKEA